MSVESVLERLDNDKITNKRELLLMLVKVMEIIEKYEKAKSGKEKKELAISVLKEIIKSSPISDEDKELLDALISNETVSDAIDVIVMVAKGDFEITTKAVKKGIRSCLMSCLKKQS